MKYLILLIGLACYIVGLYLYFKEDYEQEKKSRRLILTGGLLIIANFFYLWYSISNTIGTAGFIIIIVFAGIFLLIYKDDNPMRVAQTFLLIVTILVLTFLFSKFPHNVTLENDVIKMDNRLHGNRSGGVFKISDIQSIDTVSVYPRVLRRRGGVDAPGINSGIFELSGEKQTAKLRLYQNNPPYIKIRVVS